MPLLGAEREREAEAHAELCGGIVWDSPAGGYACTACGWNPDA